MVTRVDSELFAAPARRVGVSPIARTLEIVDRTPGMISFACGNPATEALPAAAIAAAASAVLAEDPVRALQYVRPRGIIQPALVELLARDGIAARPEELLPTTGAIQALALIAHALVGAGDLVITECPTYPVNLGTFRARGARVIGVPMDAEGLRVDRLEALLAGLGDQPLKLLYVIPDAQNPTGISMSLARRRQLLQVAARFGVRIVEDAPYRGVRYTGETFPSLYALARDGAPQAEVLYVGSFAKVIAPGLRVGFVLGAPQIVDRCVLLKQGEDFCTAGLNQLVVERLIRSGEVERTVARLRAAQGAKLQAMLAALESELGGQAGIDWTRPTGGLFIWLTLPAGTDTDTLLERAIAEQVAFIPGRHFYPPEITDQRGRPCAADPPAHELRLNFSFPPLRAVAPGIAALARVVREAPRA